MLHAPLPDDPNGAAPAFGEPLPIAPSPETLDFLARRRSASALTLGEPGPAENDLRRIIALATRAPDHGKLAPWRFVVLRGEGKAQFVEALEKVAAGRNDAPKAAAKLAKIRTPPVTIAVVSRYSAGEIPEWEQRLSAGAACTLMILAAQAMGYGANWITDWYAYDEDAKDLLGLTQGERIAGFVHLGTALEDPLERVRPDPEAITTIWPDQRPA